MTNHSARIFFPGETVPKACMTPGTRNTATQQWDSIFFFFLHIVQVLLPMGKKKKVKIPNKDPTLPRKQKLKK
jgi:hypothetical protein